MKNAMKKRLKLSGHNLDLEGASERKSIGELGVVSGMTIQVNYG